MSPLVDHCLQAAYCNPAAIVAIHTTGGTVSALRLLLASFNGELAGVGMCMWLAAAAWLASMVPGLSASAQGAATQALQRRHSGALSRAKSAMCCCGGWLAVRRPGPGARSWGLGAPACPRAATQPIPARPGPGTLQVAEHPPERRRRAKEPIILGRPGGHFIQKELFVASGPP